MTGCAAARSGRGVASLDSKAYRAAKGLQELAIPGQVILEVVGIPALRTFLLFKCISSHHIRGNSRSGSAAASLME